VKRTIYHKSLGKSQKTETKVKHDLVHIHAHLATITMIPLRVRGNVRARLEAPEKQLGIDLDITKDDQGVVKVTMPMVAPDKVHARPAALTNIALNHRGNVLVKAPIFTNAPIPTLKLTKDTTSNTACPGVPVRKPRHARGSACASQAMMAMK
jgi:hypothetical protein